MTAEASQDAAVATFEDLTLEPKSHWAGPADNAEEVSGAYGPEWVGTFKSGSYEFVNSVNPAWGSWMGCSYSNMTATSFESLDKDQWNSAQAMVLRVLPITEYCMEILFLIHLWK